MTAANKDQPLLRVEAVTRTFAHEFVALKDIDLELREGEFVALLGPSGCGKSTLLRIITGLIPPTAGKVFYRGERLVGVNPHATMVFQSFALFPWLTVLGNVLLALEARGVDRGTAQRHAEELIDLVGMDGFESAYPRELSGGMRQKVGFARALAVEPELLCLDEPFSALDVLSAEALRGELLELWQDNKLPTKAILMVSHDIEEAVTLADRLLIMNKEPGRIVAELTIDLPHPRSRTTPGFEALVDAAYTAIAGRTQPEHLEVGTAPGTPGTTRMLPDISLQALAGMLEHVNQNGGRPYDIYRLDDELGMEMADLIAVIETAELLGFATVREGDIQLTPLGEAYAEASIQARKEMFASRARRIPLIAWLLQMLTAAPDRQLPQAVVLTALELEFPPETASRQLDIAIHWGRNAELIDYQPDQDTIHLERTPAPLG
jgi:NitT/TauT family transport system ATP-binding protein